MQILVGAAVVVMMAGLAYIIYDLVRDPFSGLGGAP